MRLIVGGGVFLLLAICMVPVTSAGPGAWNLDDDGNIDMDIVECTGNAGDLGIVRETLAWADYLVECALDRSQQCAMPDYARAAHEVLVAVGVL